ncbi:MAG: 50S ribosomal protein L6 [Planctomycetota bacterium]|nr:50S ribosomal protein L6 [Planctomycetota bacterium]
MSRIGKKSVEIPAGVKVAVKDHTIEVQGPKGKLSFTARPEVAVAVADGGKAVNVGLAPGFTRENKEANAYWGTTRALVRNMVEGVTKGYEKNMEVIGVGWVAAVTGKKLKLTVGFANSILMDIPDGVTVTVEKEKVKIVGTDKQVVGQFASAMRAKRKPEPYNGKGIKYAEEVIKRKQGKQFGA